MKEIIARQTEVVSSFGRSEVAAGTPDAAPGSGAGERAVDAVLADSFPASDPPSWTPTIAETGPSTRVGDKGSGLRFRETGRTPTGRPR